MTMNSNVAPKIHEILQKVVNGNIENFTISVDSTNKKGEGYLGQIFFVSLKNKTNGKQLKFVVKQAFSEQNIREFGPIRDVFLNETYFYTQLWPKLYDFQKEIPQELRFVNLAKCMATLTEENFERIVLEDLKHEGFVMHEKKKPLGMDMFEFIFKVYGKFHAVSFAYKAAKPEEFSEMVSGVREIWEEFMRKESFEGSTKFTNQRCLDSLQPGVDDAVIEKFKHYVEDGTEVFLKSLENGRYTCLVHGDCWSNNMMFKYDESGKLIDLRFLDFQLTRLGSPVCDLAYCLYSGGTKDTFDRLDHLLQVYHDSLSANLRAFGFDSKELYPLEALKADWKIHCQLGVIMGFAIWLAKMTYDEELMDLTDVADDMEGGMQQFYDAKYDEEGYAERVRGIILHLYERDYLL